MAYYELEPFGDGERNAEFRNGLLASILANSARDEKKRREPFEPNDFIREGFRFENEKDEQASLTEKIFGTFGMKPPSVPPSSRGEEDPLSLG